ncbi:MAG: hypothetical protein EKK62_16810 [Acidimicrobiia bacterium]|nr:MAG: hypothetical protein EKK62_16810 [Acidimicrobiia bacterium]
MSRFTDHAAALCRRAPNAKSIRIGAVTVLGPVGEEDRVITDATGAERLARVTVAVVPTASFPSGITRHSSARVDGTTYTVRDVRRMEDGELLELVIAEAVS